MKEWEATWTVVLLSGQNKGRKLVIDKHCHESSPCHHNTKGAHQDLGTRALWSLLLKQPQLKAEQPELWSHFEEAARNMPKLPRIGRLVQRDPNEPLPSTPVLAVSLCKPKKITKQNSEKTAPARDVSPKRSSSKSPPKQSKNKKRASRKKSTP